MNTLAIPSGSGTGAATGSAGSASSSTKTPGAPIDPLTDKQTFLKLLVAQLKNQNPLNPTDGTQFLAQLTDISSLEQLVDIRQDTDKMAGTATPTTPQDGSNSGGTGSSGTSGSGTTQP